jgi:Leucine-rich repeat (LRR) protein
MSSSRPRPISNHLQHREIRSTPDEAEPSFSYEQESFLAQDRAHEGADDVEDEFHRRLAQQQSGQRRESSGSHSGGGSSFWRSSTDAQQGPSFSSVNLNSSSHTASDTNTSNHTKNTSTNHSTTNNNNSSNSNNSTHNTNTNRKADATITAKERKTSGLLGAALQSHALSEGGTLHESWNSGNGNMNSNSSNAEPLHIRHRDSSASLEAKKKDKKEISKHRAGERRLKMESQTSEVEIGHIVEDTDSVSDMDNNFNNNLINSPLDFGGVSHVSSLDRSSSDQSTGSLLYGKTPNNSALLGKSSSLIFPTGVEGGGGRSGRSGSSHGGGAGGDSGVYSEANNLKRRKINLLLDQCESVRFLKKKLVLNNLGLSAADVPVADLCGTPLGNALHKLSLAGNRLVSVPVKLVQSLPTLKHLDLSQCELHQLPDQWNLPQLKRLNLSHNRLTEFPEEVCIYLALPYKLA